jgi:hypothetical protein
MSYIEKTKYNNFLDLIGIEVPTEGVRTGHLEFNDYLGLSSCDFYYHEGRIYTFDHSTMIVYKIKTPSLFFKYLLSIMEIQNKLHVFTGMDVRSGTSEYTQLSKSTMEYAVDSDLYVRPSEIQKILIYWSNLKDKYGI